MSPAARSVLRTAVVVIGVIETLAMAWFIAVMLQTSGPIGGSIGQGMAMLTAIPLCLLVLPDLWLGHTGRWLPAALAVVVIAVPISAFLWLAA